MRRPLQIVLVAAFLGIIAAPGVATLLGREGADPAAENRTLAAFPEAPTTWSRVRAFLPGLDAWFADHFAFRRDLVQWHGISRYFWLGMSPTPTVASAPRGWLFYVDDGGLEDFTNASPMTDADMTNWRAAIVRAKAWCEARGITYFFTVAPDKSLIYPEFFPQTARRVSRISRVDQVLTSVSDAGVAIDVRPALLAEKRHARLFNKTDTHWNPRGAYVAYRALIEMMRVRVPAIPPPPPLDAFDVVVKRIPGMDLAAMMGLKRVLGEEMIALVPRQPRRYVVRTPANGNVEAGEGRIVTEIPGSTLPRAVIFRDSFTSAMAPFLSEHFSRAVYVWRNDFAVGEIEAERPDVVLQEIVSRHVQWYVPSPELIPDP